MARFNKARKRQPGRFAQAPLDPVARHGTTEFLCHRETSPCRSLVLAVAHLHDNTLGGKGICSRGGEKILPFHDAIDSLVGAQCPARFMRTAACGLATGGARSPCGLPSWPCGTGSRAGACGQASRVERCASQSFSVISPPFWRSIREPGSRPGGRRERAISLASGMARHIG